MSSRSSQSSRSTSSGRIPLAGQSGSQSQSAYDRYDPRYTSGYTSSNSSRSSSKSDNTKIPPSISQGSSSRDPGRSKTDDERYYASSTLDPRKTPKKPLSSQKGNDARYYANSSYY